MKSNVAAKTPKPRVHSFFRDPWPYKIVHDTRTPIRLHNFQPVRLHMWRRRVLANTSEGNSPSCCSVVAFTCAGRFSVCNRLSYASFAALYFFCRQNERGGGKREERETERLFKPDRRVSVFYGSIWTDTKSLKTSSHS